MISDSKMKFMDTEAILTKEKNEHYGVKWLNEEECMIPTSPLNCPFCGSDWIEVVKVLNKSNKNKFYTRCMNCGARTRNQNTSKDAIKLWNRRAGNEPVINN